MTELKLTRKDFVSDQMVRWCPGCGDYAILAQMQRVLSELGIPREDIVFISGIGCSSRFPYYMDTYGIHSIHGRAPTLASGLKITNPNLQVWVITGDGDGLSIGGNHLIHTLRRNIDLNIILFNNRIYGLTKGQYSPTSLPGTKSKSSPMGSIDPAFNPIAVAIGSGATFIARTAAVDVKHMAEIFRRAAAHKGTSFIEVYQNCIIFNDGTWSFATDPKTKHEHIIYLEDGKPLIFGKNKDKGIRLNGITPEIVSLDEVDESELLVHQKSIENGSLAYILSQMHHENGMPEPMGIFRSVDHPVYEQQVLEQIQTAVAQKGKGDLQKLLFQADTWTVSEDANEQNGNVQQARGGTVPPSGVDEEYVGVMFRDEATSEPNFSITDSLSALNPRQPLIAAQDITVEEAVQKLKALDVGLLALVDDSGKLAGVFTEGDVLRKIAGKLTEIGSAPVKDFMTANVTTLQANDTLASAIYLMSIHRFRHILLVNDDGKPSGVLSSRRVAQYIQENFAIEN